VGQTVTDRTLEELAQEFQGFEPPLFPSVERVGIDDVHEVLVLTAPRAARAPVAFRGVAYERVLNTTRMMPRETYQRLLLEEMHATERWENRPAAGWDVSRLDRREMVLTLEESIRRGRVDDPGTREPLEILRGLGLLVDGDKVSRAAVVLFCADDAPLPDFSQLLLKVARFKGTTRDEFLDNRQFHGNAFALMRRAERFLIDSLPVASRIVPGRMEGHTAAPGGGLARGAGQRFRPPGLFGRRRLGERGAVRGSVGDHLHRRPALRVDPRGAVPGA
jgi:ATP-dependent DNA helicase RecG